MSLTSFYVKNADVRSHFRAEFRKPAFDEKRPILAPPVTKRYATVGTAFDYLFRFILQRLNPGAIESNTWIADKAVDQLIANHKLYEIGSEILSRARSDLSEYIKSGNMSRSLVESSLRLATLDPIFRAGAGHQDIGKVQDEDIQDLTQLISLVDVTVFRAKRLCLLNPTFGEASSLVHGADADLVIDDCLIDVKTTKACKLDREMFDQIMGYYVLHQIGSVGGLKPKIAIQKLGIYFSRYGYLYTFAVSEVVNTKSFPKFMSWFEKRAKLEYS